MFIGEVCNREVVVVTRDASIAEAARLLRDYHVGDLVVIEETDDRRVPIGILTDRDIVVEVLAPGIATDTLTVGDVMSFDLLTAGEDDSIWDTLERMRVRGVRRVPVIDAQGSLVGIVSVDDLLDLLCEELTALARLIRSQQTHERQVRSRHGAGPKD